MNQLSELYTDLANNIGMDSAKEDFLKELLGGRDFMLQNDESIADLLPYEKFIAVFDNNIAIADHLEKILSEESDKDIYDLYELLYKSLMTKKFSTEYFENEHGHIVSSDIIYTGKYLKL